MPSFFLARERLGFVGHLYVEDEDEDEHEEEEKEEDSDERKKVKHLMILIHL
jgi:hypothetical protein